MFAYSYRSFFPILKMVFHLKQHNFLRSIIISTVFEPQQTLHCFKHLDLISRSHELLHLLDLLQATRSIRHTSLLVQLLGENFLRPATSSKFFIPWVLIRWCLHSHHGPRCAKFIFVFDCHNTFFLFSTFAHWTYCLDFLSSHDIHYLDCDS